MWVGMDRRKPKAFYMEELWPLPNDNRVLLAPRRLLSEKRLRVSYMPRLRKTFEEIERFCVTIGLGRTAYMPTVLSPSKWKRISRSIGMTRVLRPSSTFESSGTSHSVARAW